MAVHPLGVSGSTIMSDTNRFHELFWDGTDHIEIGEFENESAFVEFMKLCKEKGVTFGVHSPLYRGESKYDLIEQVDYEPEQAWSQLEREVEWLASYGAAYVLVHFPYFKETTTADVNESIEAGLKKLSMIEEKYQVKLVCEPKLGRNQSSAGIDYLDDFPLEVWEKYGIGICIDIGDYLLAKGDQALRYISKWNDWIHVVHIHNVITLEDGYLWTPVHPTFEKDANYFRVQPVLQYLAVLSQEIKFVFEHTPHTNPSKAFVQEGYAWVKNMVWSLKSESI